MNIEIASSSVRQSLKMRQKMEGQEEPSPSHDYHSGVLEEKKNDKHRLRTVALINLAGMMERMDEQASHKHPLMITVQNPPAHLTSSQSPDSSKYAEVQCYV